MVLNVLKGAYPTLQQIDKTLPKSADETGDIERGSLLYENADNEWRIAGVAQAGTANTIPGPFLFLALMPDTDLVAGMAGDVPTSGNEPVLTGLAISPSVEIETDMYDSGGSYTVGQFLKVGANGNFVAQTDGFTAIGIVTKTPYTRWVNNAPAVTGWRTGNNVSVIALRTMYVPNLSIS